MSLFKLQIRKAKLSRHDVAQMSNRVKASWFVMVPGSEGTTGTRKNCKILHGESKTFCFQHFFSLYKVRNKYIKLKVWSAFYFCLPFKHVSLQYTDNYFMSLGGTETSQWIDHAIGCMASSKSISCTHAGSGWTRQSDSAHSQLSFNEGKPRFGVYTESVQEGSLLSGASHY